MEKTIIILALLGTASLCMGQTKDLHKWSEGLPDWSDHQIVDLSHDEPSSTAFTFSKERRTIRKDGTTYSYYDVTAAFHPSLSWVRSDSVTDDVLAGIRKDFDLLEYFARCYRDTLLTTRDKDGSIQMEYLERFQQAREQARGGAYPSAYSLSSEPFDITGIPWTKSRRGGGVSIGAYSSIPFGSLAKMLGLSVGVTLGIDKRWNRSLLLVDFSGGLHRITRNYYGLWGINKNDKHTPSALVSLNYGFDVVSTRAVRLGLHTGPAFGGYFFTTKEVPTLFVGGPGITEGLYLDLILSHSVSFIGERPESADSSLRFRVYGSHLWSLQQESLIFPAINFSVSLHFNSHPLNRR